MREINFNVSEAGCQESPVFIGYQGENEVTRVNVDFSDWTEEFGQGTLTLEVLRSGDTTPYLAILTNEDDSVYWLVDNVDTGARGIGAAAFTYVVGNQIKKSAVFRFFVGPDIGGNPGDRPDPYESLITYIERLLAQTEENAAAAAESAQDASAEAAQAEAARQAVEDLDVTAHEDPAGPSVEKIVDQETGAVTLDFGLRSGGVSTVNGKTGAVTLDLDDIPNGSTYARTTPAQVQQIETNKDDISSIEVLIPNQASAANQLADKGFVNSSIQSSSAHFRGNWENWAAVPTNPELYPADDDGVHTPTSNDYMVIQDASDYPVPAGETALEGTWRFKYSGLWATNGRNGWQKEYQVNETPLTAAQLAALNSGATAELIAQIGTNETAIEQLQTNKQNKITASGILKGDGAGDVSAAVAGTDYLAPSALSPYRTAAAQDVIDAAQDERLDAVEQTTTATTVGPASVATFEASAANMPLKALTVNIEPIQSGSGDPSPDNVRPISGRTSVTVTRAGKNLMSLSTVELGGTNPRTKSVSIGTIPPGTYRFSAVKSGTSTGTGNFGIQFFNNTTLVGQINTVSQNVTLTDTANRVYAYMASGDYSDGKTLILSDIQLELGSTASAYKPYQGDTYTIQLGDTVYGGTLDVTGGKLTVEWAIKDLGTLSWLTSSQNFFYTTLSGKMPGFTNLICTNYKTKRESLWDANDFAISGNVTTGQLYIRDMTLQGETGAEFKADMSGVQLCYELATPFEITLTPTQIDTLLGQNNIWADAGDITVVYGAYLETLKTYAEQLGDSILSAIAPLESTYTASRAYTVGSYLFVGTKFYKVTAAIGSGDTITPDTNVTQTTVAEQLMALANV